jgi:plastocyanin
MRHLKLLLLIAALALPAPPALAAIHHVNIIDFEFVPAELEIAVGDSVQWTNGDNVNHTVTHGVDCTSIGEFESGNLPPGESFGWKFDAEGDFPYFCLYHCPQMEGVITVTDITPLRQTSWAMIKALHR